MKKIPKPPELLPTLQSFEVFEGIQPEALQWLIDQSDYHLYEDGESMFKPGQAVDTMQVIVDGKYYVRLVREGEMRELGTWETGMVTGVLPFSRMKEARAYGIAQGDLRVLELHRDHFTEMVNVSYSLTQNLVATMSNRIREFTSLRFQDEKLMALGRLSAGLAHELNNPASAMKRSAEELYQKIHSTPEKFKNVITMRVTPEETDAVNAILFDRIKRGTLDLSLMEREEQMDELLDWLEEREVEQADDLADTFVDFGITTDDLARVNEIVHGESVGTILRWMESTLSLERLVGEIRESADRISTLVQSVKAYSHMDRSQSREAIDIHEGLRNTLVMLKHKFKDKHIQIEKEWDATLPRLEAHAGELNQVWTNLIVNAIDAMDEGGTLTIRTRLERDFLCVEVQDSGSGIPEEDLSKIFDPFYTTKPMGEGTGMGLDIVQKIVERHRASIKVRSRPGETVFTVCFPVSQASVPA